MTTKKNDLIKTIDVITGKVIMANVLNKSHLSSDELDSIFNCDNMIADEILEDEK